MAVMNLKAKQDQQGMGYDDNGNGVTVEEQHAKEDQQGQVVDMGEMYEGMSYDDAIKGATEDKQQKAVNATTTTNAIPPFTYEIMEVIEWGGED